MTSRPPEPDKKPSLREALLSQTGADLPFALVRKVILDWVSPFNNVMTFVNTIVATGLLGGLGDLFNVRGPVIPALLCISLAVLLACLVLQMEAFPALSKSVANSIYLGFFMRRSLPAALLVLALVCAVFAAWGRNKPRGALATASPTLRSLQDALFSLQKGVDALVGANAAHQAAVAADPASIAVVNLIVAGTQTNGVALRATLLIDAKNLAPGQATFRVKVTDSDGHSHIVDLSGDLATAGGGDATLAFKVPNSARELTTCLVAPYPDASQPHAVLSSYAFDAAPGGTIAQKGKTTMVPAKDSPCAA